MSKECNLSESSERTNMKNKNVGHRSGLVQDDVSGQEALVHEALGFEKKLGFFRLKWRRPEEKHSCSLCVCKRLLQRCRD